MRTVSFYGASDDLIEVDGIPGADEFAALDQSPEGMAGSFVVGGKIRVRAYYDQRGVWGFSVSQVTDAVPLPDWPIRISQQSDCDYSTRVEIDCPDDATVIQEARQR